MKVYLSIPISGRDIEVVKAELDEVKKAITAKGWESVSPLDGVTDFDKPWLEYIIEDLKILSECDAILLMKGWSHSAGCQIENIVRHKLGLTLIMWRPITGNYVIYDKHGNGKEL